MGRRISQWYEGTVPSGVPSPLTDMTLGGVHPTFVGEHTGHSLSLLTRLWYTSWFAGAAAAGPSRHRPGNGVCRRPQTGTHH